MITASPASSGSAASSCKTSRSCGEAATSPCSSKSIQTVVSSTLRTMPMLPAGTSWPAPEAPQWGPSQFPMEHPVVDAHCCVPAGVILRRVRTWSPTATEICSHSSHARRSSSRPRLPPARASASRSAWSQIALAPLSAVIRATPPASSSACMQRARPLRVRQAACRTLACCRVSPSGRNLLPPVSARRTRFSRCLAARRRSTRAETRRGRFSGPPMAWQKLASVVATTSMVCTRKATSIPRLLDALSPLTGAIHVAKSAVVLSGRFKAVENSARGESPSSKALLAKRRCRIREFGTDSVTGETIRRRMVRCSLFFLKWNGHPVQCGILSSGS
mmetsp:Transcript_46443/g.132400  ORF Transcript_46443/g.132400 Transcript_46443/m.132400 type:complete len:333 (-) Transcript_46443:3-1001(-)